MPVERYGGLVMVMSQLIAQVEELSLELAISCKSFSVGIDDDQAIATIDYNAVAGFSLTQDTRNSADGRIPRLRAMIAAWLVWLPA